MGDLSAISTSRDAYKKIADYLDAKRFDCYKCGNVVSIRS